MILSLIPQIISTIGPAPICLYCKRFNEDEMKKLCCEAFPDKIPNDIIMNRTDHRHPVQGDQGLQFEPTSDEGAEYANELLGEIPT